MDSWEGIGPDHFYTTGTTYHRWSSERSRFWGVYAQSLFALIGQGDGCRLLRAGGRRDVHLMFGVAPQGNREAAGGVRDVDVITAAPD